MVNMEVSAALNGLAGHVSHALMGLLHTTTALPACLPAWWLTVGCMTHVASCADVVISAAALVAGWRDIVLAGHIWLAL
jgi:hypothetical protein